MSTALRLESEAKFPDVTAGGRRDYVAWAKRFVYRYERGDNDIKKAQIGRSKRSTEKRNQPGRTKCSQRMTRII
jgi:hypothetical protein